MDEPVDGLERGPGQRRRGKPAGRRTDPAGAQARRHRLERRTALRGALGARIRYRYDRTLTRGPLALIAWLAAATLGAVLAASLLAVLAGVTFGGGRDESFVEACWQALLRVFNDGIFGRDDQWTSRILGLGLTLVGIFVAGALIGVIASAIDQRVNHLRKGRSRLLECQHTLILGWSAHVPVIVREMSLCDEKHRDRAVVVLADKDMTEMEDALRDRAGVRRSTRVVCRTGDPSKPDDLALVNIARARSVIVLQEKEGDIGVVKTVLAIRTLDPRFERGHIVVEVQHPHHSETLEMFTDGAVVPVNGDDVVAEIMAQACHQDGVGSVYRQLLTVEGAGIFFADVRELVGHSYEEAALAFEHASVIGWLSKSGVVELNPPPDLRFGTGDQVIVIAEDERLAFTGFVTLDSALPPPASPDTDGRHPTRVLVIGWSSVGPRLLRELDWSCLAGSYVEVAVDRGVTRLATPDPQSLVNTQLHVVSTSAGPQYLAGLASAPFDQVIVLGYRDTLPAADADARTLLTLLSLRTLWPAGGPTGVRIIGELLDQANLEIAHTIGVDDIIVSDLLTGLMIVQLSERAELQAVFADLVDAEGAVIDLQPAPWFVAEGSCTYAAVVAAGARRAVSVIGYRHAATGKTVINPPKAEVVHLVADDRILVVGLRRSPRPPADSVEHHQSSVAPRGAASAPRSALDLRPISP